MACNTNSVKEYKNSVWLLEIWLQLAKGNFSTQTGLVQIWMNQRNLYQKPAGRERASVQLSMLFLCSVDALWRRDESPRLLRNHYVKMARAFSNYRGFAFGLYNCIDWSWLLLPLNGTPPPAYKHTHTIFLGKITQMVMGSRWVRWAMTWRFLKMWRHLM